MERGYFGGLALRRPAPQVAQVYRNVGEVAAERGLPLVLELDPAGHSTLGPAGGSLWPNTTPAPTATGFKLVHRREAVHANNVW